MVRPRSATGRLARRLGLLPLGIIAAMTAGVGAGREQALPLGTLVPADPGRGASSSTQGRPAGGPASSSPGRLGPDATIGAPADDLAPFRDRGSRSTPAPSPPPPALPGLPEVISHGDRAKPQVALTFDSNMTAGMLRELDTGRVRRFVNDRVISILREEHVPATFFLSGLWVERYPDVAAGIAADPLFEVASHSYAHLGFTRGCYDLGRIDPSRAADDVRHSEAVLDRLTPQHTRYFRFPGGCYDSEALASVRDARVQVVQYDVASGDAFATDPSRVVAQSLRSVTNGSIIVMHVTGGNTAPVTDRALPAIIAGLRARGLVPVTLSQLLAGGAVA